MNLKPLTYIETTSSIIRVNSRKSDCAHLQTPPHAGLMSKTFELSIIDTVDI